MTADAPGATQNYSTRPGGSRDAQRPVAGARGARTALGLLGLAGTALLVVSTFTTVVQIQVLTTTQIAGQDTAISGNDLHGIALLPVAGFGLLMLYGAVRGARPAMAAVAATGLLALGLVIGLDVPELNDTGQVARFYEDVSAGASTGFYCETLGAVLLLLAGGLMLLLSTRGGAAGLGRVTTTLRTGAGRLAERSAARRPGSETAADEPA
jgi:hypothetical protein